MPFARTSVVVTAEQMKEMWNADEAPTESTVRGVPPGEWTLEEDGTWRFWRYDNS